MPRPKRPDYTPPPDLLDRLPKASVTRGEKLKTLEEMTHRQPIEWRERHAKVLRAIDADVRAAGRTHKDSAPVVAEAPSSPNESSEAGSSIAERPLERKINQDLILRIEGHTLNLYAWEHDELLYCLSPDLADQLAHALAELAGDLRRDANARAWSQELLNTTG